MKKFVSEAEFMRLTGLSRPTVRKGIEDGKIKAVRTEQGHYRINTANTTSPDTTAVINRLEGIEAAVMALCKQLGIKTQGGDSNG